MSMSETIKKQIESNAIIIYMKGTPDAIFIIDTHLEDLAVREARATGVTTIGITDTNSDPTIIDYPIPANDDALGSIQLITDYIIDAWIEGRKAGKEQNAKEQEKGETDGKVTEKKKTEKEAPKQESAAKVTEGKPKKPVTKKKTTKKAA